MKSFKSDAKSSIKKSRLLSMGVLLHLADPASSFAAQACNSITVDGKPYYINNEILRQAALKVVGKRLEQPDTLKATTAPAEARRCDGGSDWLPAGEPDQTNYFGNAVSKQKFIQLANKPCGANDANQYFSVNSAIYVRQCGGGQGNNYIYFWGKTDLKSSQCFRPDYPSMYALANSNKKSPVTLETMKQTYSGSGTGPLSETQSDYALINAMAAIQISEVARDWLVLLENYMLMDTDTSTAPHKIIGGHCIKGAATCHNTADIHDGLHPLAWGGAKSSMMAGGAWGEELGATGPFGITYEGNLIATWAHKTKLIASADPVECLRKPVTWANLNTGVKKALKELLENLLPRKPKTV